MKNLSGALAALGGGLVWVAAMMVPLGPMPRLGPLFDPFQSAFREPCLHRNGTVSEWPVGESSRRVQVGYDTNGVPHIKAANMGDLMWAMGRMAAQERMWQMDFLTRAASGRLSEIAGRKALNFDKRMRRFGLAKGAESLTQEALSNPETKLLLEAFSDGVNSWQKDMRPESLPIEYTLMGMEMEPWTPLKSSLIIRYMAWDLTGDEALSEIQRTNAQGTVGSFLQEWLFPVVPPLSHEHRIYQERDPVAASRQVPSAYTRDETLSQIIPPAFVWPHPNNGSNNWAVSAARSASGGALLANDPHLGLTVPSLWLPVQLEAPGLKVAGVTIPGVPGVVLGFNEKLAWGFTNAGADVLDWYRVNWKDESHQSYKGTDGQWHDVSRRLETIRIRGEDPVVEDVPWTEWGPVASEGLAQVRQKNVKISLAMRWTAHDASNEFLALAKLNRAHSMEGLQDALGDFAVPAQNVAFAFSTGEVGMFTAGRIPLRHAGQGRVVSVGEDPNAHWEGFIPSEENPHVLNPHSGVVSSANQVPVDSRYPYWWSGNFAASGRGTRIQEFLKSSEKLTLTQMETLQMDVRNMSAQLSLPGLLGRVDRAQLSPTAAHALSILESWDMEALPQSAGQAIYETWWDNIVENLKKTFFPSRDYPVGKLNRERVAQIFLGGLKDLPEGVIVKDGIDTRPQLLAESLNSAVLELASRQGTNPSLWTWAQDAKHTIPHLAHLPGFGSGALDSGKGTGASVLAWDGDHGPSWRLLVDFAGQKPRARWSLPGGVSGNAGGKDGQKRIEEWMNGTYLDWEFDWDLSTAQLSAQKN